MTESRSSGQTWAGVFQDMVRSWPGRLVLFAIVLCVFGLILVRGELETPWFELRVRLKLDSSPSAEFQPLGARVKHYGGPSSRTGQLGVQVVARKEGGVPRLVTVRYRVNGQDQPPSRTWMRDGIGFHIADIAYLPAQVTVRVQIEDEPWSEWSKPADLNLQTPAALITFER